MSSALLHYGKSTGFRGLERGAVESDEIREMRPQIRRESLSLEKLRVEGRVTFLLISISS